MSGDRPPWRRWLVSAALTLALQASPLRAQAPDQSSAPSPLPTGTIAGTVVDPTGAVIPGATVTLTLAGSASATTTTSTGQGSFTLTGLAPGIYVVEANSPGFRPARVQHVTVQAGKAQHLTLTLPLEVQQQQVIVNANQLDSSPDKNGDAIILKGSDLDSAPRRSRRTHRAAPGHCRLRPRHRHPVLHRRILRRPPSPQIRHPRNPHEPESLLRAVRPGRLRPHRDLHQARRRHLACRPLQRDQRLQFQFPQSLRHHPASLSLARTLGRPQRSRHQTLLPVH